MKNHLTALLHWLHDLAAVALFRRDPPRFDSVILPLYPAVRLEMVAQRIQPWLGGSPLGR